MLQQGCLFLAAVFCSCGVAAQSNVGINTSSPTETLDVNGNVKLSGYIRSQIIPPKNGDVLVSTGSKVQWQSAVLPPFSNVRSFIASGTTLNITWQKPSGINQVIVEAWGAGGGGASNGGGGSGGYVKMTIDVSLVAALTLSVGRSAESLSPNAEDGGNTVISWISNGQPMSVTVPGGKGASNNDTGVGGFNFVLENIPASMSILTFPGKSGQPSRLTNTRYGSSSFATHVSGAIGGDSHFFPNSGGQPYHHSTDWPNTTSNLLVDPATNTTTPGAGGGGCLPNITVGELSGPGMVIIRW